MIDVPEFTTAVVAIVGIGCLVFLGYVFGYAAGREKEKNEQKEREDK